MRYPLVILLLLSCFGCKQSESKSQDQVEPVISDRFESEIRAFEDSDQLSGYQKDCILFTGSSSIRMWETLEADFDGLPVLNRGFGGATIPEVNHFAYRYLFDHSPQVVVFYCGENDISEGAKPQEVYSSFLKFTAQLQSRLPNSKLVYLSMKPSPSRWNLWGKFVKADELIKAHIDENQLMYYFDTGASMLHEEGEPRREIFIEDQLHMNGKGYEGWTKRLKPLLDSLYTPNFVPRVAEPAGAE